MGNVTILAPLAGPVLGGLIITYFDWRMIFVFIAIAALITYIGLLKYTPKSSIRTLKRVTVKSSAKDYLAIFKNKSFILGTIASSLALIPLLTWIGMAPVLIMEVAKRSFTDYIVCQIIALSGLSIASILMQFIAGKFAFYKNNAGRNYTIFFLVQY